MSSSARSSSPYHTLYNRQSASSLSSSINSTTGGTTAVGGPGHAVSHLGGTLGSAASAGGLSGGIALINLADVSLRDQQTTAVLRMLNLNAESQDADGTDLSTISEPIWKVLIFDRYCQDIISSLLRVNDLRENGVTLHLLLESARVPVTDVPAVYFVEPTVENIRRIGEDLAKGLYDSYYVNFSSTLPRQLLEDLAAAAVETNTTADVAQVFDQYLHFLCPESNLFHLNHQESYLSLNNPQAAETAIEAMVNSIVSSLFSVLVTLGSTTLIPVIRAQRGSAAEMVARRLDSRLRDHFMSRRSAGPGAGLFQESSGIQRPVLVILDRNVDLAAMMAHSWNYQALIHDALEMRLNQVTITEKGANGQVVSRKKYDVDSRDYFWARNSFNPFFPQVASDIDAEITKYKADTANVTKLSGVSSIDEIDFSNNTKQLKSAITALPELTARKNTLDAHMNIATAVSNEIKERQLDRFLEIEESISRQSKTTILEMLRDPAKKPDDKMRLLLMYMLSLESDILTEEMDEYQATLEKAGCDVAALTYVKRIRALTRMTAMYQSSAGLGGQGFSKAGGDLLGKFSTIGNKLTDHLKEGGLISGVGGVYENLVSSARSFIPSSSTHNLPVTRMVEALMDPSSASSTAVAEVEELLYFDPKLNKGRGGAGAAPGTKGRGAPGGFLDAIVFVVGGANYVEYQNLMEYAKRDHARRRVTYGGTEIVTPTGFLRQLEKLGRP